MTDETDIATSDEDEAIDASLEGGTESLTKLQDLLRDLLQLDLSDLDFGSKISDDGAFRAKGVVLDGFLLTRTELSDIPDVKGRKWPELEKEYRVIHQDAAGEYVSRLLKVP